MDKEVQSIIDRIWETFWTGGVTNPVTIIEQITYLLFLKELDDKETNKEKDSQLLGVSYNRIFDDDHQDCRWSKFKNLSANQMYKIVSSKAFPFIKDMHPSKDSAFSRYMANAMFVIPTALVLEKVVTQMDKISMKDKDTRGDVYEYLLAKMSTSGTNGQFRTPRHIIKMMVELLQPTPADTVCDPACGTGGFLVATSEYLEEKHKDLFNDDTLRHHYINDMFYGFDTDQTMLRISAMNMIMHGIDNPTIIYKDSISEDNTDNDKYSIILANPPFKGTIDYERTSPNLLKICKTKKTELLFISLFLRSLKIGGRCACIVPDGVIFDESTAHKTIRKELIENQKLEAVISMPKGVFEPYAGVSTGILIFTKTNSGGTDNVWFYDMKNDGFSLDKKRVPLDESDIPDIINRFHNLENEFNRTRKDQSFMVPKEEIVNNNYDLFINKYKEIEYEPIIYPPTSELLNDITNLNKKIEEETSNLSDLFN